MAQLRLLDGSTETQLQNPTKVPCPGIRITVSIGEVIRVYKSESVNHTADYLTVKHADRSYALSGRF